MEPAIETVPSETRDTLVNWTWPGDVRELENFIGRSVMLTEGSALLAPVTELKVESHGSVECSLEKFLIRTSAGALMPCVCWSVHGLRFIRILGR